MSIFGKIAEAIFGGKAHASTLPDDMRGPRPEATPPLPTGPAPGPVDIAASSTVPAAPSPQQTNPSAATPAARAAQPKEAMHRVDVAAILDQREADKDLDDIDWRRSIVDLMKVLDLDSSLKSRKALASELGYSGDMGDSAAMNVWLHKQVMTRLAESGGIVPASLKH